MITFFVPGVPVAKGSAKAFFRKGMKFPVVVQDNVEKQRPWASLISLKAEEAGCTPVTGGCALTLLFWMPRPKCHYRASGELKPAARVPHTKKPDLDKLLRCVKDALSGIAYQDDSQVTRIEAKKEYLHMGRQPGCFVEFTCEEDVLKGRSEL